MGSIPPAMKIMPGMHVFRLYPRTAATSNFQLESPSSMISQMGYTNDHQMPIFIVTLI
jgi:hypothetical protein